MKDDRKLITIVVEGTEHEWPKDEITYEELVALEVPDFGQRPEVTYSVKYTRGKGSKPAGILVRGATVAVKDRMVFNVSDTGQS